MMSSGDRAMLESALSRAQNKWVYEQADLAAIAAAEEGLTRWIRDNWPDA